MATENHEVVVVNEHYHVQLCQSPLSHEKTGDEDFRNAAIRALHRVDCEKLVAAIPKMADIDNSDFDTRLAADVARTLKIYPFRISPCIYILTNFRRRYDNLDDCTNRMGMLVVMVVGHYKLTVRPHICYRAFGENKGKEHDRLRTNVFRPR